MLYQLSGDILKSSAPVIVHGIAPNDPFHTGLALQLRELMPAMYKDFRHYCQVSHPQPGDMWAWAGSGPRGTVQVVCLMTQDGGYEHGAKPGRAHLEHVSHALKKLRKWIDANHPEAVALPRLATGVGGLEWDAVWPLVQQHLGDLSIPVYVYTTFHKGVEANEPRPVAVKH